MSDTTAPAAAPPRKKSGVLKWIVISLVVPLLLGGAGSAAWWFFLRTPPGAGDGAKAAEPATPRGEGIVVMDQFLVNLADKDAQRFARVTLRLVVETKEQAKEVEADDVAKARLRSAILELLTQQTADALTSAEGKAQLKKSIAERAAPALGGRKVLDVLFTDFVVQF